jgi:hypothetical protein
MRRCCGFTKTIRRCSRLGEWRFFCDDHRRQPLIWFTTVFTLLAGGASFYSLAASAKDSAAAVEAEQGDFLWQATWVAPTRVRLTPTNDRVRPLEVELTFPTALVGEASLHRFQFIGSAGEVELGLLMKPLKEALAKEVACDSTLACRFLPALPGLPVVITSRFALSGRTSTIEQALYIIRAVPEYIVEAPTVRVDSLDLQGFRFLRLLDPRASSPVAVVDSLWSRYEQVNDSVRLRLHESGSTWWRAEPPTAGLRIRPPTGPLQ